MTNKQQITQEEFDKKVEKLNKKIFKDFYKIAYKYGFTNNEDEFKKQLAERYEII